MIRSKAWILVILTFSVNVLARGADILQTPVREFIFHGKTHKGEIAHVAVEGQAGIEEALHNLASHAEVPIAIEVRPEAVAGNLIAIEIDTTNSTVGKILADMVRQDPRYWYRERLGIIEVLPTHAGTDRGDCLNMVIPNFRTDEEWKYILQSLRCQIDRVTMKKELLPDPVRAGVCPGGSFGGLPHPPSGIIRMTFENEQVRDILDKLAAKAGNIAWEASFKGPSPACNHLTVNSYQPRQWYPSDGPGPVTWSEGLPEKCMSCHYHSK